MVLHGPVDPERGIHVVRDVEELRERQGQARVLPRRAAVVRNREALVEDVDQVVGVLGVDPEAVVVAARGVELRERAAAVNRDVEAEAHRVHRVGIVGVHADLPEHPPVGARMALHELLLLGGLAAHLRPRLAPVVGPVHGGTLDEAAGRQAVGIVALLLGRLARDLVVIHQGVDHVRLRQADVEPDAAPPVRGRQALVDGLPRLPSVHALVDPAAAVVRKSPRVVPLQPRPLPRGGIQRVGIARVHGQVDGSGLLVDRERLLPRLAAVGRLVDAALRVDRPLVP